jgi:hypothetical protein
VIQNVNQLIHDDLAVEMEQKMEVNNVIIEIIQIVNLGEIIDVEQIVNQLIHDDLVVEMEQKMEVNNVIIRILLELL